MRLSALPVLLILTVAFLFLASSPASASLQITGNATRCSGISACSFAIDSNGTGMASTYGGAITFQLPGEAKPTDAPYSTQYVSSGSIYHVRGAFVATDANDGKVVTGSTDVFVRAFGHSGRGGGISYSLLNGTITFNATGLDGTFTSVTCSPSPVVSGSPAVCIVTVSDPASPFSINSGNVTLYASNPGIGVFPSPTCILTHRNCLVPFLTNQEYGPGTTSIFAAYSGDRTHYPSTGRATLYVIPSVGDE